MIEIPLNSSPEQIFNIVLNGQTYDCRVVLNSRCGIWFISFAIENVDVVNSVALLGGVDILKQYNIALNNAYVVNLDNPALDPNKSNLGISAKLFLLTDEELQVNETV